MSNAVQTAVAAYLSGRNRIINGAMQYNQRVGSIAASPGTYQYGGADRWANVCGSGQTPGVTQSVVSATGANGSPKLWLRHQVTTAVTDFSAAKYWGGFSQTIEGWNCYDMRGSPWPIAVSFQFQAKLPGQYSVTLFDSGFVYSSTLVFNVVAVDTPQYVQLIFPPAPAAMSFNATNSTYLFLRIAGLNAGTNMCPTANLGQWVGSVYYAAQNNVNWGASTNNYIQATEIQLEAGGICTPFEQVKFSDLIGQCQRYFETGTSTLVSYGAAGASCGCSLPFKVAKRTSPTVIMTPSLNSNCSATPTVYPGADNFAYTTAVTALGTFQLNSNWQASIEMP
jgi:hypothetical protein